MKCWLTFSVFFCFVFFLIQVVNAQTQEQLNIRMLEAAKNSQADSVEYWLNKGANVNFADKGFSALHYALLNYHFELCEDLIKSGAKVNGIENISYTPIFIAAFKGNLRGCYLLYINDADLKIHFNKNKTAVDFAEDAGYIRVAQFLKNPKTYSEEPTCQEYFQEAIKFYERNNVIKAIEYAEKAKMNAQTELKENHILYIQIINYLTELCAISGDFLKTESLYIQLIQIIKEVHGENHPDYATSLNNLACFYDDGGHYEKAESLYIKSLQFHEKAFGKNSLDYALALNNLATFYYKLGQYNKTIPNLISASQIFEKSSNEDHPNYAIILDNLALLYVDQNEFKKAESIYFQALNIRKNVLGEKHPDYTKSLMNLANFYDDRGQFEKAEELYIVGMKILKETIGENTSEYALFLNNLATLYHHQNIYWLAESYYLKALNVQKEILGENHPNYIVTIKNLSALYIDQGNYDKAERLIYLVFDNIKETLQTFFNNFAEAEREIFWHKNKSYFDIFRSFAYMFSDQKEKISEFVFSNELFLKGIMLNSSQKIKSSIINSKDSVMVDSFNNLLTIKDQLNIIETKTFEEQDNLQKLLLRLDINKLDKELTKKSLAYRQVENDLSIKWQDVQNKLLDNEAVIEFTSFSYYNRQWTDSILYCALVVKKDMEHPEMIPLFEQKQLDSLWVGGNLEANYLYASRGIETIVNNNHVPNGEKLYNLVWKPLEKSLEDVHTVYYAPSGNLHQVAFAALPVDSSTYLCDRFNLVQLSSTRQLATSEWQTGEKDFTNAVLFGGIKYDLEEQELAQLKQSLPPKEETILNEFRTDSTLRSGGHTFLEGTKTEIDSIAFTLQTENISAAVYNGISASEESFKALTDQDIGILHIATHGFFFPDEKIEHEERERFMLFGEQRFRKASNPLLRSGLILAGGNRVWKGEEPVPGMEDGILTAQEISEMYLPNTELVVLSACETGLGEIQGGEGVFGLQRAFKLAGVETILMSLWKVPDNETSELMQIFYKKWLNGMDKHAAFRSAQLELRHKYPHEPKKWAGFVMVD